MQISETKCIYFEDGWSSILFRCWFSSILFSEISTISWLNMGAGGNNLPSKMFSTVSSAECETLKSATSTHSG